MSQEVLNLGLILLPGHQWLDAAGCADYLHNHSYAALAPLFQSNPALVEKAPVMKWHYVSSDLTLVQASSGPPQQPTCTFDDCPALDIIIVPGPDPELVPPKGFIPFIQTRYPQLKALLMVCTGSMIVAHTGILDGRQVCSNKFCLGAMSAAGKLDKKVKWVGDKRWIVDGKLWSAAGVTCGIDLAAEFARVNFDPQIVKAAKEISEYKPNPAQPDPFAYLTEGVEL